MTPPVNPPATPVPDPEPATPAEILEHLMEQPKEALNKPTASTGPSARAGRHPLRVGTMVWGAVVVVLGILVIVVNQAGLHLDAGRTAMWLLLGAGVAMVAGGAVNLLQRK